MHTIIVANHAGGVGKTTTAANIAVEFAQQGYRTLLVSDKNGDSIRMLFSRFGPFILSESEERWLKLHLRFQIPVTPAIFATEIEGLHICSKHVAANYTLLKNEVQQFDLDLAELSKEYSVIVIDSVPAVNPFTFEGWYMHSILKNAHVVVPIRYDYHTSLTGAQTVLDDLHHAQSFLEGISLLGAVITSFQPKRPGVNLGVVEEMFQGNIIQPIIHYSHELHTSSIYGPVKIKYPQSDSARDYCSLVQNISRKLDLV